MVLDYFALNPVWHGIRKQEKFSSLEQPRATFLRLNELDKNNLIYLNFYLQKSLEIFEKNQLKISDLTKTLR